MLDLTDEQAELEAIPRKKMAESNEIPERLRHKLSVPASQLGTALSTPNQSFWFLVIYEAGDADCAAINASMLAPGGHA